MFTSGHVSPLFLLTELQSKTEGSNPFLLALKGKTMSSSIMLSITDEVGPPTTDQAKADLAISRNPFDSVMKHFPTTGDAMSLRAGGNDCFIFNFSLQISRLFSNLFTQSPSN